MLFSFWKVSELFACHELPHHEEARIIPLSANSIVHGDWIIPKIIRLVPEGNWLQFNPPFFVRRWCQQYDGITVCCR